MGVITRWVTRPRVAFFTRYQTLPSRRTPKARKREGRPVEVPAEALASEVVVGFDADAGVKVEALVRDGVGRAGCRLRRQAGLVVVLAVVTLRG